MQPNPESFVEVWTHLRRRQLALRAVRILVAVALGGWFASLMLDLTVGARTTAAMIFVGTLGTLLLALGSLMYATFLRETRRRPGSRSFDARSLAATQGTTAWIDGPRTVAMRDRRGVLARVPVADERAASDMLASLGLGFERRAARIPLARSQPSVALGGVLLSGVFLFAFVGVLSAGAEDLRRGLDVPKVLAAVFCVVVTCGAALALKRGLHSLEGGEVLVGTDGFVLRRDGKETRVPAARIQSVLARRSTVFVTPVFGPVILLEVERSGGPEQADARAEALVRLISRSMANLRTAPPALADSLDRQGRPASAWRAELANLARGGPRYRFAQLDSAALSALIADAAESPERRVGATIALHAIEPDAARATAAAAGDASASEDLRALLEAAAEGEIDEPRLARTMRERA